jgi:hypothetical protein
VGGALSRVLGRNTATLLTNIALLGAGFLSSAIASRALAPTGRGEYVTWQTWAGTVVEDSSGPITAGDEP